MSDKSPGIRVSYSCQSNIKKAVANTNIMERNSVKSMGLRDNIVCIGVYEHPLDFREKPPAAT